MASEKQQFSDNAREQQIATSDELSMEEFSGHTAHDKRDMYRLGKKQQLVRNFRVLTSVAFTSCVMGTWEIALTSNTAALINGGRAALFWQFIWCYIGQTAVVFSLAEMASMAPTAGGQYHWVSEFAPARLQKILSYTSGWLSTIAWQAFVAVDNFIVASLIQACILLNDSNYAWPRWHTSLLMIALVVFEGALNVYVIKWLPMIEAVFAVLHYVAWLPLVIVLWVMTSEKQSARTVFTAFSDNGGGWGNTGLMVCIGQVGAMFTVVGEDAAAHIGEETADGSTSVPKSMLASYILNIPPTIIAIVTYVFCIGDLETILASPTGGFPLINVFENTTGSVGGATGLTVVMLILLFIITTSCLTSTSRATFAFARDNGLVASKWIANVHPRIKVPVNSIIVTIGFTTVCALINIGSTTAFNAFLSVSVVALMATYTISIGCIMLKRLRGERLPHARWRLLGGTAPPGSKDGGLGRYGVLINGFALCYSIWSFFWSFWPVAKNPTPATMNWAVLIFGSIMLFAALAFVVHARKVYHGPVSTVRQLEDEVHHEQSKT